MTRQTKRHSLSLPDELFEEVKAVADRRQATVVETLRRLIRLGLIVSQHAEEPHTEFIIREEDKERQIILV